MSAEAQKHFNVPILISKETKDCFTSIKRGVCASLYETLFTKVEAIHINKMILNKAKISKEADNMIKFVKFI